MSGPVAFLIDADNLSDGNAIRHAFEQLTELAGPVAVRRAYGSAENLKGLASVIGELAIQPCQTFALSKNTTDAALVVGAMELACEQMPSVVAIASGDLDFFPLAVRLRERGVRVICFSLANKLHDEVRAAYHQCFIVGSAPARSKPAAADSVPAKTAAKKATAKKAASKKAAPKPAARKAAAKKATKPTAPPVEASEPPGVRDILNAAPELRSGQALALNGVIGHLQQLAEAEAAKPMKLLKKHPAHFELLPADKPNKVRWLQAPDA
ncbi:NYN domain-containing protein [Variovorax sp. KK3]|uniref:NYN domain-containing protein n=1 Tax=Variovorax sp. KK3 TaxID=1855728 RepID=UPI00097BB51C|nr:NYN domain-containing protein [Variovorax sp. KK3]